MARLRAHRRGQSCRGFPQVFQPKQCDVSISIHPPPPHLHPRHPPPPPPSIHPSFHLCSFGRRRFSVFREPLSPNHRLWRQQQSRKQKEEEEARGGGGFPARLPSSFLPPFPPPLPSPSSPTLFSQSNWLISNKHQFSPDFPLPLHLPRRCCHRIALSMKSGRKGGRRRRKWETPISPNHPPSSSSL